MIGEASTPALTDSPAPPGPLRVAAALLTTVSAGWFLLRLGDDDLSVPLTSTSDLRAWIDTAPPVTLAVGVLRLATLALCAYLTVALAVNGATAVAARGRTTWRARLLPTFLQHLLVGGVSIGLAGTALPVAAPAAAHASAAGPTDDEAPDDDADGTETAVMVKLDDEEPATPMESAPTTSAPTDAPSATEDGTEPAVGPATTTTVVEEQRSTTAPTETSDPESSTPVPSDTASDSPRHGDTWIVEPGDSFWSIAEEVVADRTADDARTSTAPSDETVGRYWADLIAANRDQLADPEDPDLLFSGQRLHLP